MAAVPRAVRERGGIVVGKGERRGTEAGVGSAAGNKRGRGAHGTASAVLRFRPACCAASGDASAPAGGRVRSSGITTIQCYDGMPAAMTTHHRLGDRPTRPPRRLNTVIRPGGERKRRRHRGTRSAAVRAGTAPDRSHRPPPTAAATTLGSSSRVCQVGRMAYARHQGQFGWVPGAAWCTIATHSSAASARATPFDQPNPSCVGYSPPPAGRLRSTTSYFSVIFRAEP